MLLLMVFFVTIRQHCQIVLDSVYFEGLGGCHPYNSGFRYKNFEFFGSTLRLFSAALKSDGFLWSNATCLQVGYCDWRTSNCYPISAWSFVYLEERRQDGKFVSLLDLVATSKSLILRSTIIFFKYIFFKAISNCHVFLCLNITKELEKRTEFVVCGSL